MTNPESEHKSRRTRSRAHKNKDRFTKKAVAYYVGAAAVVAAGATYGIEKAVTYSNHDQEDKHITSTSLPVTETTVFQAKDGSVSTTEAAKVKFDLPKDNLDANRAYNFPADTLIFGDAFVGNNANDLQRVFDNSDRTGAITFLAEPGVVLNPINPETGRANGLSARAIDPKANLVAVLEEATAEMKKQHASNPNFEVGLLLKQGNEVFQIQIEQGKIVTPQNGN